MKKNKVKKASKVVTAKAPKKKLLQKGGSQKHRLKKSPAQKNRLKKMATKISQTTKKMVDEVMLKLIGTRVLERAQNVSASLRKEKTRSKKVQED